MTQVLSGAVKVTDINSDKIVVNMQDMCEDLFQNSFPFETLMRKLGGVSSETDLVKLFREDALMPVTAVTTANAAAAATSIAVNNASLFRRDMLVVDTASRQVFAMDEDVGGTAVAGQIKVRRLDAATGTGITSAISSGTILLILMESHAEGEDIPPAFATDEVTKSTRIMQFDEAISVTDIQEAIKQYGENFRSKIRRKKMIEFMQRFNLALYWGKEVTESVSGNGRRQAMRGLIDWLNATATDAGAIPGGLTLNTFGLILRKTSQYGLSEKDPVTLCGQNAWAFFSALPANLIRETSGEMKSYGITVSRLITPFGNTELVYDQMLSQEYGGADRLFVIRPEKTKLLQLQGLPLRFMANIQNPESVHVFKDLITGTRGFMLANPEIHQSVYGIN